MQRLGDSDAFGELVFGLLNAAGWELLPSRPAIGGGRLWIATRREHGDEYQVARIGERFSDIAAELLADALGALDLGGPAPLKDVQLQLPIAA